MRKAPRLPPEQLAPYLLEMPPGPARASAVPLEWNAIFGNAQPVEIEVGPGKGLFLLTESQARPTVNFLGIEIERKYALYAATRVAKRSLPNVKLAWADAREFLRDRVPASSVQAVHVYFPDPWWKKRHHKRRVFTEEFAASCQRILIPGGRLFVVTDVEDYMAMVRETLARFPALVELPPPAEKSPKHDLDYLTNFERKFRQQGKPIYRATYCKTPGNLPNP